MALPARHVCAEGAVPKGQQGAERQPLPGVATRGRAHCEGRVPDTPVPHLYLGWCGCGVAWV
eukprot:360241-Chlamydomonas_euryale.AAC.2